MPDREAAKRIFMAALDLPAPERPAFIAKECKGDAALQREVEALLAAHDGKPILDPITLPAQPANNAAPKSKNIAGSARVGEEIGPYRLLERIGEGGFGEVWIAEQKTPVRRKVALKIIKAGMDTREVLARFEAERQALAVMDHPSVAKVFDAGATSGGRPYFVMEFVAGLPINAYCDSAKLRIKDRLHLFMNICHAVQHAHQKGIIHRDLKPGNIIVTLQDGKPVPKVIDFGIAKATVGRLTERTLHTETGRVIGTPEYMAPEQAGTSGLDVDTRADIYSLGVILYELLTGTLPLDGNTLRSAGIEAIGRMLNEFEPPKPSTRLSTLVNEPVTRGRAEPATIAKTHGADMRTLQRELRGDLDWITLKALEKDRTRRYETASAFAADVDRHLTGEAVIAAPPSVGYRVKKFVKKHKAGAFVAATLVLATITTTSVSVWAIKERKNATTANMRHKALTDKAITGFKDMLREASDDTIEGHENSGLLASIWLNNLIKGSGKPSTRVQVDNSDYEERTTISLAPEDVDTESLLDNMIIASIDGIRGTKELIGSLQYERDAAEWQSYATRLGAAQLALAFNDFSTAREALARCDPNRRGWEWRYLMKSAEAVVVQFPPTTFFAFSPDDRIILTASSSTARLLDAATANPVGEPMKHENIINTANFSPNGKLVLTASNDNTARLWDATTGNPFGKPMQHDGAVSSAVFSSDGSRVLTASNDGIARLWDAATGRPISEPMNHDVWAEAPVFSPDGKLILTASDDKTVQLWNAATVRPFGESMKHDGKIQSAVFSPDSKIVLSKTSDANLLLWDAATGMPIAHAIKDFGLPYSAVFSPDSRSILAAPDHSTTQLWNAKTGRPISVAIKHDQWSMSPVFSPDGKLLLTKVKSKARLWDVATGRPIGDSMNHHSDGMINSAIFSPDCKLILTASDDKTVQLWNAATGRPFGKAMRHDDSVSSAVFSHDGENILTASGIGEFRLWELDGTCVGMIKVPCSDSGDWFGEDQFVSYSPKGKYAIARTDLAIKVIPVEIFGAPELHLSGEDAALEVAAIMNEPSLVTDAVAHTRSTYNTAVKAVSPDGSRVATLTSDQKVRFRTRPADHAAATGVDAGQSSRGVELAAFRLDKQPTGLAFSLDGRRLVVWLEDNSVVVWDTREPAARRADLEARHAECKPAEEYVATLLAGPLTNNELIPTLRADPRLSPLRRVVAIQVLRESISLEGLVWCVRSRIEQNGRAGAARALERLKAAMTDDPFGEGNSIDGRVEGRKLTFKYREGDVTGEGWFELSEDGKSFAGKWRVTGDESWSDWTGTRTHGDDPARFDGLWDSSFGTMWLFTDRDTIRGYYGIDSDPTDAIILIEGYTSSFEPTTKPVDSPQEASFNSSSVDPPPIQSPSTQPTSK